VDFERGGNVYTRQVKEPILQDPTFSINWNIHGGVIWAPCCHTSAVNDRSITGVDRFIVLWNEEPASRLEATPWTRSVQFIIDTSWGQDETPSFEPSPAT
jgi:hypothetical protein